MVRDFLLEVSVAAIVVILAQDWIFSTSITVLLRPVVRDHEEVVVVAGGSWVSSMKLEMNLPSLVESDKEAHPQLTSTSLNRERSFASSALIFPRDIWRNEIGQELKQSDPSRFQPEIFDGLDRWSLLLSLFHDNHIFDPHCRSVWLNILLTSNYDCVFHETKI